tara:strand:- start:18448 stop:20025 length:1578 start_codon:yes stop_codon:yes gene_type:complete
MNELIYLLFVMNLIHGIGTWKLYNISGNKGWHSFIPIYNLIILIKIINRPWWWIFLIFLPVINVIIIPVIWIELSRSFGKNSYTNTFFSLISLGFYNYYLNYFTKLKYVENRDIKPKSKNGEWVSSIIFAVIAATFVHTYFIQPYTIPTSSLEKSLLVGDFLFVSKFHYGARLPMTTIAAPMVHDSIPLTKFIGGNGPDGKPVKLKSYLNKNQLPFISELPYYRLPGLQKIKRNEIVCFNWPVDTLWHMTKPTNKNYYKPIDKKTNYVKRAVGIAGDTLEIRDGYVFINGSANKLPERAKLQFSYDVYRKDPNISFKKDLLNRYGITDSPNQYVDMNGDGYVDGGRQPAFFPGISEKSLGILEKNKNVHSIVKRASNFPPIFIPKKNSIIQLNKNDVHFKFYKRAIQVYENNDFKIIDDKIFINGVETSKYKFKQDYYWLMGDNRGNSQDSRAWGFVPFDHVVGKPIFKWLSIDYNKQGLLNKIRWDRMFTTVHGEGKPISFLYPFIGLVILWNIISFIRKRKSK